MHFERGQDYQRAVPYLYHAAERALQKNAPQEAILHLRNGLDLLARLPESLERQLQELQFQSRLGQPLILTVGYVAPMVVQVYAQAQSLCRQLPVTPSSFPARLGFWHVAVARADLHTAQEVAIQLVMVAKESADPESSALAHYALGVSWYHRGDWRRVREQIAQGLVTYDVQRDHAFALFTEDRGVASHCYLASALWGLGYPEQAMRQGEIALALAQKLARPLSQGRALGYVIGVALFRREWGQVRAGAAALRALHSPHHVMLKMVSTLYHNAAVVAEEQSEAGVEQMRQAVSLYRSWGAELLLPYFLAVVAEAHVTTKQTAAGLEVVEEALALAEKTGEQCYDAELWRLKGELLLTQESLEQGARSTEQKTKSQEQRVRSKEQKSENPNPKSQSPNPASEAEACFLTSIDIARQQHAKSWELRAVMSLVRLRQLQASRQGAGSTEQGAGSTEHGAGS